MKCIAVHWSSLLFSRHCWSVPMQLSWGPARVACVTHRHRKKDLHVHTLFLIEKLSTERILQKTASVVGYINESDCHAKVAVEQPFHYMFVVRLGKKTTGLFSVYTINTLFFDSFNQDVILLLLTERELHCGDFRPRVILGLPAFKDDSMVIFKQSLCRFLF